jgi:hypothetical protein
MYWLPYINCFILFLGQERNFLSSPYTTMNIKLILSYGHMSSFDQQHLLHFHKSFRLELVEIHATG